MIVRIAKYDSPCGEMRLGENEGALLFCDWVNSIPAESLTGSQRRLVRLTHATFLEEESKVLAETKQQLDEYFAGKRKTFSLPTRLYGTDFQKAVWMALTGIPFAVTASYAEIARRLRRPNAVRAVANDVGSNPLSVIVPCHRVIGSDGSLTGYAGGLAVKSFLLSLETPGMFNPKD